MRHEPLARDRLVELARRLVRYPSEQTDRMEMDPAVQAFIGECVEPVLAEAGIRTRRDEMGSLIAEVGPREAGPSVMMMTYAMTHPASSMDAPFSGALVDTAEGTAIRGRGISEQKGALAAALAALLTLARAGELEGRLVFALSSAGETGRHDAARCILDALPHRPDLCVVAIGSNGRVALGNKGRIDVEVTVAGKASHSSMPWAGVNAIDGARAVLDRLAAIDLGSHRHPGLGAASLTSTSIESWPKATHTIQDRVRLTLDRRLLPGDDVEEAFRTIAEAARAAEGPWSIDVRRGAYMHPCEIPAEGRLMYHARRGHAAAGLPAPATFWSHAALDAGYLGVRGCEAAMWGPGRVEQFHTDEEQLLVDELVAGANAYLGFLRSALETGPG